MGFELFFSWQAGVLAVLCVTVMQGGKVLLDFMYPGGAKARKANRWITRLLLPAMNGVLGFVLGVFVPFRPDAVTDYVLLHHGDASWFAFGCWGVVVGAIFGHFIYDHAKSLIRPHDA